METIRQKVYITPIGEFLFAKKKDFSFIFSLQYHDIILFTFIETLYTLNRERDSKFN